MFPQKNKSLSRQVFTDAWSCDIVFVKEKIKINPLAYYFL